LPVDAEKATATGKTPAVNPGHPLRTSDTAVACRTERCYGLTVDCSGLKTTLDLSPSNCHAKDRKGIFPVFNLDFERFRIEALHFQRDVPV
jgi:hypothetical protein